MAKVINQVGPWTAKTCTVDGCDRPFRMRGFCGMHYQRWYKYGDPGEAAPRRKTRPPIEGCSIEGCNREHRARGLCILHYNRWRNRGDPGEAGLEKAANGTGLRWGENGRATTVIRGHYLAIGDGRLLISRLVLFNKIGFGPHRCNWCAVPLSWMVDLTADHVDGDRTNDHPMNLVASCKPCNTSRGSYAMWEARRTKPCPNCGWASAELRLG